MVFCSLLFILDTPQKCFNVRSRLDVSHFNTILDKTIKGKRWKKRPKVGRTNKKIRQEKENKRRVENETQHLRGCGKKYCFRPPL